MSISSKIQSLITAANSVTGESRTDLTAAVQDLVDGYGFRGDFKEVEYIESSGTQYIDTLCRPDATTIWEFECAIQGGTVQKRMGFTSGYYSAANTRFCFGTTAGNTFYFGIAGTNVNSATANDGLKHKFKIDMNTKKAYIDDNEFASGSGTFSTPNGDGYLFANHGARGVEDICSAKLYSCKIYQNNILVRQFIPCVRKIDDEVGLFDLANYKFYANAGTGDFIVPSA